MKKQGKDLKVKIDGATIACSTSCTLDIDVDLLEVSSQNSGKVKEFISQRSKWSLKVAGLLGPNNLPLLISKIQGSINAEFTDGTVRYTGTVLVKKLQFTGQVKNIAKYNATFQGSGNLTQVQEQNT